MSNRILKESICVSDNLNQLSSEEEVFFYRIIVQCDDYGRTDAREDVLRARCFPLKLEHVSVEHVNKWLKALADNRLVYVYKANNKQYLQVVSWSEHQKIRNKRSKYPEPLLCNQLQTNDYNCSSNPIQSQSQSQFESQSESESESAVCECGEVDDKDSDQMQLRNDGKEEYSSEFLEFWNKYPRKIEKKAAYSAWKARLKKGEEPSNMIKASDNYALYCRKENKDERYIKHAKTFLGPGEPYKDFVDYKPSQAIINNVNVNRSIELYNKVIEENKEGDELW